MVTVIAPGENALGTVTVATLLFPVVVAGLKVISMPLGSTMVGNASKALNVTAPVKPPLRVIVTVAVALAPGLIVRLDGLTDSEKSACGAACALKWMNKIADANTNSLRG
jgi:hypothetical protein